MNGSDDPNNDPSEALWRNLLHAAHHDDGAAAKEHLQAGFPVYYVEDDTPSGLLVKEHPDGQRELVRFGEAGDEVVQALAKCIPYDTANCLKTEEDIAGYLDAVMEDGGDDPAFVARALDVTARARTRIASAAEKD